MDKIKEIIIKSSTFWFMVGSLLVTLGAAGVNVPEWAPRLFSKEFVDALLVALGGAGQFISVVRAIFAVTKKEGDVQSLSYTDVFWFYANPLKFK